MNRNIVYVLQSVPNPSRYYVGRTDYLDVRVAEHNSGLSPHTSHHRPWRLVVFIQFGNFSKAEAFERYLKSGSGRSFAKRHF